MVFTEGRWCSRGQLGGDGGGGSSGANRWLQSTTFLPAQRCSSPSSFLPPPFLLPFSMAAARGIPWVDGCSGGATPLI